MPQFPDKYDKKSFLVCGIFNNLDGVRTLKFHMALKWPKTSPSQSLLRVQKTPMKRILNSLLLTLAYVAIHTNKIT